MTDMRMLSKVVVVLLAAVCYAEVRRYDGYQTYRLIAKDASQVEYIRTIGNEMSIDFWTQPRAVGLPIDVMVAPENQAIFVKSLEKYGVAFKTLVNNVQETIDREDKEQEKARLIDPSGKITFNQFYRYDDIVAYVQQLAKDYPELVSVSTIGKTYEGRNIVGVTVSSGGNGKKNAVLIEGGIHAREWIAPCTILYLLNQLVENYTANKALVDGIDWLLVPVTNPDGYEYTHTNDRMWRKNRNGANALCKGADANRNFGYKWGGEGASTNPCSETYRGASAFSEKESSAVRDFGLANSGRVKVYLAMHSYGPYFLYPWGYQWDLPDDWQQLDDLAQKAASAIRAVNGTRYEIGSSTQLLYAAAGGSDDYMKGGQNIAYAYTVELPGGGSQGFNPPASSILPIVRETWEGLKVVGQFAATQ